MDTVLQGLALGAACGLRVSVPWLAVTTLAAGGAVALDPSIAALGTAPAVLALGGVALLELAADKVPGVDHALDAAGFVLKPVAAFGACSAIAPGDLVTALVAAIVAAAIATGKTGVRVESSTATRGLGNPLISLVEDGLTCAAVGLALLLPPVAVAGLGTLAVGLHGTGIAWRRARWGMATG